MEPETKKIYLETVIHMLNSSIIFKVLRIHLEVLGGEEGIISEESKSK
jgi:hypothetical protein